MSSVTRSSPQLYPQPVDSAARAPRPGPELSVIVPTFNERQNVRTLVGELESVLAGIEWEVVFVDDDSPDETAKAARDLARKDARVRCMQRIGRRGLSSACVEGMLGTSSPYVAVMDGDLQHDPSILPTMLALLKHSGNELVVGSRYTSGGGLGEWSKSRQLMSRLATRLGYTLVPSTLKDPMSGFFMLRRELLDEVAHELSGIGFKILLDVFASARRQIAFVEVPYVFRMRRAGESKIDSLVIWEYAMLLCDKLIGPYVPVRFLSFAAVGSLGVIVHLTNVALLHRVAGIDFVSAQTISTIVTIACNYALNNLLTYRDRRRRGWRWFTGLASFFAICSLGAVANVGVAAYLFEQRSGWIVAAVAGVLAGVVWNYAVSSMYTWGKPRVS